MGEAFVIAVDGPSGVGKSTVSRRVARHFDLHHLDIEADVRHVVGEIVGDLVLLEGRARDADQGPFQIQVMENRTAIDGVER